MTFDTASAKRDATGLFIRGVIPDHNLVGRSLRRAALAHIGEAAEGEPCVSVDASESI
jgi:hypothetical protein